MTVQSDPEVLVLIEFNGRTLRVRGGSFSDQEFRAGLLRAGAEIGEHDAIGLQTRPSEPYVSVLAEGQTVVVREGLEVWTGNRQQEIDVTVNNAKVVLMGPAQQVSDIKAAAAAQGAELPDEFVLGIVYGRREVADLDDALEIFVRPDTRFLAVGHDDDA